MTKPPEPDRNATTVPPKTGGCGADTDNHAAGTGIAVAQTARHTPNDIKINTWQAGLTQDSTPGNSRGVKVDRHENFVSGIYASVDGVTAGGLDRLRNEAGITPSCRKGCHFCCRYHILMNIAEAHTLAQYLRREWSAEQMAGLRRRTRQWHEWDNSRPGRYPMPDDADLSNYDPCCPLLIDDACGAYPVRPVVCRTHYVTTHPRYCAAVNDPQSKETPPEVLSCLVAAGTPFASAMREYIENTGIDFCRSIMLLPHWLAIEMGWEFAIL